MTPTLASTSNTTRQPMSETVFPPQPTAVRFCKNCGGKMSWIKDRPNHRWRILCYVCRDRTRRKQHGGDLAMDYRRRLNPTYTYSPDLWNEDWITCWDRFFKSLESGSPTTAKYYKSIIDRFFSTSADGKPKRPEDYTYADVDVFLNAPNAKGYRNAGEPPRSGTKGLRLQVLQSFYSYAARFKILGRDGKPTRLFTGDSPTESIRPFPQDIAYHAMTQEEVRAFFSAIDTSTVIGKRDYAFFTCSLYLARRLHEIIGLRWGDIERTIVVDGQTRREAWVYYFFGKGRKNVRDVAELPVPCMKAITEYLQVSGRLATISRNQPVFLAVGPDCGGGNPIDPYKPLSSSTIEHAFRKYRKIAGIDPARGLTVHSFRHTSAQMRVALGADLLEIQKLLRHASPATTGRYLFGLVGTADQRAVQLEQRLQSVMSQ